MIKVRPGRESTVRGIAAVTGEDPEAVLDELLGDALLRAARQLGTTVPELRARGSLTRELPPATPVVP